MSVTMKNEYLHEWVEHLMLYSANAMEPGLYVGKMGICVCFAECARYFQDTIFVDLAGDLLEDVLEGLSTSLPINFSEGLCGIGWGIEYLLQRGCLSGDSDEILKDFDKQVMCTNIGRVEDFSMATGLAGIAYYVYSRLVSPNRTLSVQAPFDSVYLQDWIEIIPQICKSPVLAFDEIEIFRNLGDVLTGNHLMSKGMIPFPRFILPDCWNVNEQIENLDLFPKGLCNGLAGMIVNIIIS